MPSVFVTRECCSVTCRDFAYRQAFPSDLVLVFAAVKLIICMLLNPYLYLMPLAEMIPLQQLQHFFVKKKFSLLQWLLLCD